MISINYQRIEIKFEMTRTLSQLLKINILPNAHSQKKIFWWKMPEKVFLFNDGNQIILCAREFQEYIFVTRGKSWRHWVVGGHSCKRSHKWNLEKKGSYCRPFSMHKKGMGFKYSCTKLTLSIISTHILNK